MRQTLIKSYGDKYLVRRLRKNENCGSKKLGIESLGLKHCGKLEIKQGEKNCSINQGDIVNMSFD